jgi:hypothetical protein
MPLPLTVFVWVCFSAGKPKWQQPFWAVLGLKGGYMYMTSGIVAAIENDEVFASEIAFACAKFMRNDWGDTCKSDCRLNDDALKNGDRIVALYKTSKGKVFIITEIDRNITTILFGNEY